MTKVATQFMMFHGVSSDGQPHQQSMFYKGTTTNRDIARKMLEKINKDNFNFGMVIAIYKDNTYNVMSFSYELDNIKDVYEDD